MGKFYFVLVMLLIPIFALAFPPESLNGKWDGTPPLGGSMQIDINLNSDNTFKGGARIRGTKIDWNVSGKLDGDNVLIQTHNPKANTTVTYKCKWVTIDVLECETPRGHKTNFTRS